MSNPFYRAEGFFACANPDGTWQVGLTDSGGGFVIADGVHNQRVAEIMVEALELRLQLARAFPKVYPNG
jgi:hypothetical protein